MNALDRVIAAVSPQTAVKRAAARRKLDILDSGYGNYGASHTKKSLAGWLYGGGSAKEDMPIKDFNRITNAARSFLIDTGY